MTERLTEVKLVDHRGRPQCVFRWGTHSASPTPPGALQRREPGFNPPLMALIPYPDQKDMPPPARDREPHWMVTTQPPNTKARRHIEELAEANPLGVAVIPARVPQPRFPVSFDDDGEPRRLDIPSLSWRWEKVVATLESLAQRHPGPALQLTVQEFIAELPHHRTD